MKTRTISSVALGSALSLIFLYVLTVIPTLRIALCAVILVTAALTVVRCGKKAGIAQYAVTTVLAFILLPDKLFVGFYALFLGHYAVCKSLIEGLNKLWLEWILKLVLINVCMLIAAVLLKLFLDFVFPGMLLAWFAGNVVFIIWDIALTVLIDFFVKRLRFV